MVKKIVGTALALVLLYTIIGSIILPYIVKIQAETFLNENSVGTLHVDDIHFNPYTFIVKIEKVKLTGPSGLQLLRIGSVKFDLDLHNLVSKRVHLKELYLHDLQVNIAHFNDRSWSYAWLMQFAAEQERVEAVQEASYFYQLHVDSIRFIEGYADLEKRQLGLASLSVIEPSVSMTRYSPFTGTAKVEKTEPEADSPSQPWHVRLEKLHFLNGKAIFQDFLTPGAAYIVHDRLIGEITGIDSDNNTSMKYALAMRANETGHMQLSGSLSHTPLSVSARVNIDKLPLEPGSPYLQHYTHAALQSGSLSMQHDVRYAPSDAGADLIVTGDTVLEEFELVDTRSGSRLAAFEALQNRAIDLKLFPGSLNVEEVVIKGPYADVVLSEAGSMNFVSLLKKANLPVEKGEVQKTPAPETAKEPFPVSVAKVTVIDGSADFTDRANVQAFDTRVSELNTTVLNLSSNLEGVSHIKMNGVIDTYGTMALEGRTTAAAAKRFTDLSVGLRNLDLQRYTPYSEKFVARKIDGGKMYVDLGYKIDSSQIKGDNGVVIKKINLGDTVESNTSVSLPLDLAVALLEDGNGVIDIDLPVEGDLNNPDFKYGATVWKAVANLLTNVATAPFKFLGSLLGIEGEQLQYVEFKPGDADIATSEREKLDLLAKALKERPGLSLSVQSIYETVSDTQALKVKKADALILRRSGSKMQQDVRELMNIALMEKLVAPSMKPEALQNLKGDLRKAHKEDAIFEQKYIDTLYNRLIAMQQVDVTGLEALAEKRSGAVAAYLGTQHGVDSARVIASQVTVSESEPGKWIRSILGIEAGKK
jgi:hypothetical protein